MTNNDVANEIKGQNILRSNVSRAGMESRVMAADVNRLQLKNQTHLRCVLNVKHKRRVCVHDHQKCLHPQCVLVINAVHKI